MAHLTFLRRLLALLLIGVCCAKGAAQSRVMGWGDNRYGQLGVGSFDTSAPYSRAAPTELTTAPNLVSIADGFYHSLGIAADGTVWAWGYNYYGQLGIGTFDTAAPYGKNTPAQVPGLTGVIAVAAGTNHSLALKSDGTVWAWGWNVFGQLGDGSGANQKNPIQVKGLTNVKAIAAGGVHSMALLTSGAVMAWGGNTYGELGDDSTINRLTPVPVWSGTAIACGQYHSLTLAQDGTLYAWGSNSNGQLGDGTTTAHKTPKPVTGLTGTVFFTAGAYTSLAIRNDGTVRAWGWNAYGQIGDGTTIDRAAPTAVSGLTNAIAIASGQANCLALKADGTVWTWGWNAYGQAGSGAFTTVAPFGNITPQPVAAISSATGIAGGGNRAHALLSTAPMVSVSGVVTLEGPALPYLPHTLSLRFRPVIGGAGFLRAAALNPDGSFTAGQIPPNKYQLWIKAEKWLASVVTMDASGGDVSGIAVSLAAGDSNNDNSVDSSDFTALIGAYNSDKAIPGSGYDPTADFNDDGSVDSSDFTLLIQDFNAVGAD